MNNTISATVLKNKVSHVLNETYYRGIVTVVERHGRPIAKIVPMIEERANKNAKKEKLMKWAGVWNNDDGKIIERHARNLRKTAKFIS